MGMSYTSVLCPFPTRFRQCMSLAGTHRLVLRRKTFDRLVCLVEYAGVLIPKAALLRAVWLGTAMTLWRWYAGVLDLVLPLR
jgi:hypothetical protein